MNHHYLKTFTKIIYRIMPCILIFTGCSSNFRQETKPPISDNEKAEEFNASKDTETGQSNTLTDIKTKQPESSKDKNTKQFETSTNNSKTPSSPELTPPNLKPTTTEADWSEYFNDLNGAAVLYNASNMHYIIFEPELAKTRRSPCSTFKIISSLTALESGTIEPKDSIRTWSKEMFWNENWNRDIDFYDAFRTSCIWYFREIIDILGKEKIQEELDKLAYGNLDISDWEGRLNTNNNNRALTGFWVESSLMISPKEQTEVMARIFGPDSVYSEETRQELKQVMQIEQSELPGISIYGKTGMGKAQGIVVDAWFTGFAENLEKEETIYFCIYLGQSDDKNFSSTTAKEIAIRLISEYWAH